MSKESHRHRPDRHPSEPVFPTPLTTELSAFLKDKDTACLTQATVDGAVYVVKLPASEIVSMRGRVPIRFQHELYQHEAAPVIRTVISIYDKPNQPMKLETYTNVADEDQRNDFASLAGQWLLHLLFYDEQLTHRLSKAVPSDVSAGMAQVLSTAEQMLAEMDPTKVDFDRAKEAVMRATQL